MRRLSWLWFAALVTVACSHKEANPSSTSDTVASERGVKDNGSTKVDGSIAEKAVKEYAGSLADGSWNFFFKYDEEYRKDADAARQSVPSGMWAAKEASLQAEWTQKLTAQMQASQKQEGHYEAQGYGGTRECFLVLKRGAMIDFSKLEVRPLPDGSSQAFVPVAYPDQSSAPSVTWTSGARKLKSAILNLTVKPNGDGTPFVQRSCDPVEGAVAVWDIPDLTPEQAAELSRTVIPQQYTEVFKRRVGTPSSLDILKSILEKHGIVVTPEGPNILTAEPSDTLRKWVVDTTMNNSAYDVVLFEQATSAITNFKREGQQASALVITTYTGCTPFCELWKELVASGGIQGGYIRDVSYYELRIAPDFAKIAIQTRVNYTFDPDKDGWVASAQYNSMCERGCVASQ